MVQKIYSKMHAVSCTKTHHDVTDLVNYSMVRNTEIWLSWKQNIFFPWNKKILNLCPRCHIFRSNRFLAEVTFKQHLLIYSSCREVLIWGVMKLIFSILDLSVDICSTRDTLKFNFLTITRSIVKIYCLVIFNWILWTGVSVILNSLS